MLDNPKSTIEIPNTPSKNVMLPMLTLKQQLAYVVPSIGVIFLMGPINVVQGIYAKYFGLSLTSIATVMLVARIFDAVTDPLIGYYSDRFRAITGTRKPFILLGAVLLVPCSYFLFVPHQGVGVVYFAFWYRL